MSSEERFNTIVIGGGQAGLAAGYYLTQRGDNYTILDENQHMGESWRRRWDSLRLFTPSQNNHLPGLRFPKPDFYFPTKDETADYLDTYAKYFNLPVSHGVKVEALNKNEAGYHLSAASLKFHVNNVIIATGAFHTPYIPDYAAAIDPSIIQLHSSVYRNPSDMPAQNVLVVGAGNSGAEIALDLAKSGKKVWLAGRDVGRAPGNKLGKLFGGRLLWWFLHRVMTVDTPLGRKMKANVLTHGNPLVRIQREDIANAGVEFTPRMTGSRDGKPQLENGHMVNEDGIIWATGFRPDYDWVKLPIFDASGRPRHERGVVLEAPGLYFVGLHFQTGLTSSLLGGVGTDARYITNQVFIR